MKLLSLSLRLFCKRPWANLILSIELAVAALAVMIVGNMYLYSTHNISVLQNSPARILYCSNYDYAMPGGTEAFREKLAKTKEQFPEVKGFSTFIDDWLNFNREKALNMQAVEVWEAAEAFLMDDVSIKNLPMSVSKGSWLSTDLTPNGNVPCVLGGLYANQHDVGEVIPAYPMGVEVPGKTEVTLEVVGILAQPIYLPHANMGIGTSVAVSQLFNDVGNHGLMAIVPGKYVALSNPMQEHFCAWGYIDRSCTPERLDAIRASLIREYTALDTDMIADEKEQIGQTLQVMLPYIIVLFLVVLTGLLSVSVLTTMKNMRVFKIYYLTGSSKWKIILFMMFYILFFYVIAAILFGLVLAWMGKNARLIHPVAALDAYFLLNPSTLLLILLVCAAVLVCSLVIPFVLLRKNDLSQLLRKE